MRKFRFGAAVLLPLVAVFPFAPAGRAQASSQPIISTFAGTAWSFPSRTLPALNSPLGALSGVAADSHGNVFIADPQNYLVLQVAPSGTLSVVAGNYQAAHTGDGGLAVNASLQPGDVAVDAKGNLFILDQSFIREVTPDGNIKTVAGNGNFGYKGDGGAATNASINTATGILLDPNGVIYFADTYNDCVRKIANGVISTFAGQCNNPGFSGDGKAATAAQLSRPSGLAFDPFGNICIADSLNGRIRMVSTTGVISTLAGATQLSYPAGLATDSAGNLYIADSLNNEVYKYSFKSAALTLFAGTSSAPGGFAGDGGAASQALLNGPSGVAVDASGNLYIADAGNERLRQVNGAGKISTTAGNGGFRFAGDGGKAINAQLNSPSGMAFDTAGNLYFADTANNRIRKITPAGVITTLAGNGIAAYTGDNNPALSASLNGPTDVALDGNNANLFVADAGNSVIRKIALSTGVITTVAGGGQLTPDGVLAISSNLLNPVGIAIDRQNNLYIADEGFNCVIQVASGTAKIFVGQPTGFGGYTGDGTAARGAALKSPQAVALDSAGNLYIADTGNNVIRKVNGAGIISTVAGNHNGGVSGPDNVAATSSVVLQPEAISVAADGSLLIAGVDGKIRGVSPGGIIQTLAGGGAPTVLADGGPAVGAGINQPQGVLVDSSGNMFIADTGNGRIRKVFGAPQGAPPTQTLPPSYQVSATSITFTQVPGQVLPSQSLSLTPVANSTTPAIAGLPFTASVGGSSCGWLSLSVSAGTMPATVVVTANPAGVAAGAYSCTITISAPGTTTPTSTVSASLTVPQPPPSPKLAVDQQTIPFTAAPNSGPVSAPFHVLNSGGGTLSFTTTVTSAGGSWLTIAPSSGSATPDAPFAITATATPSGLQPGTYTGTITVSSGGSTQTINVTLAVTAPTAQMLVSEAGLSFTAVSNGGAPLPHNFGILNIGSGSMDWQASVSTVVNNTLSPNSSWLQVSPTSGTVARPFLDVASLNATIDPTNLAPGTYYGRITITSQSAVNNPQLITVTVNVLPAGFNPGPEIYPTGLIFTGVTGAKPGSQTVRVANSSTTVNSYQSGIIPSALAAFSFLPLNSNLTSSSPTEIQVYPDLTKVSPGAQQRGTITLQFADGSPAQSVNVLTVVAPAGTATSQDGAAQSEGRPIDAHASSSCSPLQILFRSISSGFTTVVGQAMNVDVQVTDACGNLIGPGGSQSAKVIAFFNIGSNGTNISMTHIGNGVWQGTWTPSAAGAVAVYVTAAVPSGASFLTGQTTALTGTVTSVAAAPLTSAVTHAASQGVGLPIAPGELITIYGANLASSPSISSTLPLPTQSEGLQVLLGLTPLPILYTSSGQMNVQVPYSVPVNTQYQLSVVDGGALSVPQTLTVAQAVPGIFTVNQQGTGQGVIVKSDQVTVAQPGTPASIGETVVIYCTGLGVVTPAVKEGMPPTTASQTVNPATVTIGGANATVVYAGVTPGFPGLYQINATIPAGIQTGDTVPVKIIVANQPSQVVTMAVR
jgi:uncharacterized protein (TIGR03437 family)